MTHAIPRRIFVTGTDTGVGKTFVSAVLTAGIPGAGYWKPLQTGSSEGTDTQWVRKATGLPEERFFPESHIFAPPLSPHAAAALAGVEIDLAGITLPSWDGPLIVEGAGGVMVPVNSHAFMLDLMRQLALPVLVVARSGLGTINHTLLTVEKLENAGIGVLGVVMNGPLNPGNRRAIENYGKVPVVGETGPLAEITPSVLKRTFEGFDWSGK